MDSEMAILCMHGLEHSGNVIVHVEIEGLVANCDVLTKTHSTCVQMRNSTQLVLHMRFLHNGAGW